VQDTTGPPAATHPLAAVIYAHLSTSRQHRDITKYLES
jgi:hypothetical protein